MKCGSRRNIQLASWDSAARYGWLLYKNTDISITNRKKPQTFSGNVYVLTAVKTFSSAMDFAMLIKDNGMGVLVGETSGNRPDSYGDCLFFQMPNSKLAISISYKRWYRVDKSRNGEPLYPDYDFLHTSYHNNYKYDKHLGNDFSVDKI